MSGVTLATKYLCLASLTSLAGIAGPRLGCPALSSVAEVAVDSCVGGSRRPCWICMFHGGVWM